MKNYILKILFFVLPFSSFCQEKRDTIFIVKNLNNKIYFESSKESKYYKLVSDFTFSKKKGSSNWIPIQKYNDKYYFYDACDGGTLNKISISKNIITIKEIEIYELKINKFIKLKNYFKYVSSFIDSKKSLKIEFKLIDKVKQIAIFKFTNMQNKSIDYRLMVNSNKIYNYEIIVNECYLGKESEVVFQAIDLEKLFEMN